MQGVRISGQRGYLGDGVGPLANHRPADVQFFGQASVVAREVHDAVVAPSLLGVRPVSRFPLKGRVPGEHAGLDVRERVHPLPPADGVGARQPLMLIGSGCEKLVTPRELVARVAAVKRLQGVLVAAETRRVSHH